MSIQIISHTSSPSESLQRIHAKLNQHITALHYGKSVSKLVQYQYFKDKGINHPEWSINIEDALKWQKEGDVVIVRTKVKGQCGSGIVIVEPGMEMPDGKVFTRYIKKKREFRVNLFKHKLVNVREKVRVSSEGSSYIRNRENGYSTVKCKVPPPDGVVELAITAAAVSDSDFIGVDIGYNQHYNKLFVLEVNSGPAIEGSSVDEFVQQILKVI